MSRVSKWDLGDEETERQIGQLWDAFASLKNREEIKTFLSKFFTPTEIQMLGKRLEILKLADSELEVMQLVRWLGISKATIYTWLEKHDAFEADYHIVIDRLKDLDKEYLNNFKRRLNTKPRKFTDKPVNRGYKKRQKRKSVLEESK